MYPMTKHLSVLVTASLATLLALFTPALAARADIFRWEYINPANPALGKQQSTTLTPDGAGANAVPGADLSNRNLTKAYLIGADLSAYGEGCGEYGCQNLCFSNLTGANLSQADLTNANFTLATLTNANFSQANLANASFTYATLTGANLTGAEVRGASFHRAYLDFPIYEYLGGITVAQLSSTASYQAHDLTEINLSGNNLAGVNLAGQNLTNAYIGDGATLSGANLSQANLTNATLSGTLTNANFSHANLTRATVGGALAGANFAGAEVRGAILSGITAAQFYSTSSYQAHDLSGIALVGINLTGGNLAGQNLTGADLHAATLSFANLSQANLTYANFSNDGYGVAYLNGANLSGANLTNANFRGWYGCDENGCVTYHGAFLASSNLSGADARGARFDYATLDGADTSNLIQSDGHIAGLDLTAGASLVVRDYDGNSAVGLLPIVVEQHLAMDATGTLRLVFDADPWDSTISFAPGIPVALGGMLELAFAPGVDVTTQSGRTIDLFDWTGVTPTGAFTVTSPYTWNLTKLYTTGEVTLTAVPSLPGDFNNDGTVDTADYIVWREGIGVASTQDNYNLWRSHFGQTTGSGSVVSVSAAVPEPASLSVLLLAVTCLPLFPRRCHSPHRVVAKNRC
jgi:uncharacterized protein YjbI with pentapeptide repeats